MRGSHSRIAKLNVFSAFGLFALTCLCSCATPLVWRPAKPLVTLHDVHGLFGGHDLLIDQSGQMWLRVVDSNHKEKRYFYALTDEQKASLIRQIGSSGIMHYREKPYQAGPCELHTKIHIELPSGQTKDAGNYGFADEPVFFRFKRHLRSLIDIAKQTKPYSSGESDWKRPLP